jgi:hypothetical protein
MDNALITEADYESLPPEPERRFLVLESICKKNLYRLIIQDTADLYDRTIRLEYMAIVAAAAEELGIDGLWHPSVERDVLEDLAEFSLKVSQITTRLQLRNSRGRTEFSVQLSNTTKARIKLEVERLRGIIGESDLEEARRQALLKKLDELVREIEGARTDYSKVMAVLAIVGASVMAGTSFLADAPNAIATITSLVGKDKEAELKEQDRLGPPPVRKALPSPPKNDFGQSFGRELEDEIPF